MLRKGKCYQAFQNKTWLEKEYVIIDLKIRLD